MTWSVAIGRNQHCWGSQNEAPALPQQHPYGNGYSRHAGCISTIFGHVSFTSVRGTVADGKRTRHRTSFSFQSAAPSPLRSVIAAESSPGGGVTAGSLLPFWRGSRLFQFFPALKVAGDLLSIGFHRTLTVCQDTAREFANVFHLLCLSAGLTGLAASVGRTPTSQKEIRKCPKSSWRNPK